MNASLDKKNLQKTLESLLGFDHEDDGGAGLDVLEHLLTIEVREDLKEYLAQLLGDESAAMVEFVDNAGRYQRGESLEWSTPMTTTTTAPVTATNISPSTSASTTKLKKLEPSSSTATSAKGQKVAKSRVPAPRNNNNNNNKKNSNAKKTSATVKSSTTLMVAAKEATPSVVVEAAVVRPTGPPRRGKATVVCGCFGIRHPSLTNCLFCGRISCAKEGYDFCPFCGFLVEQVIDDGSHADDPGWAQKERLLRFDRDFARRTQIVDDQGDFQAPSSGWMTQEEEEQAQQKQSEREDALTHRSKQTLNLAI